MGVIESNALMKPRRRFNFIVLTMSAIFVLNALVVPSILVLLLDKRCFWYYFVQQEPHEADVPIVSCGAIDDSGEYLCPDPYFPNDGYQTAHYRTTFDYPWSLSDQCGSAVVQAYGPVVISEPIFGGFLQPTMWWLCIDGCGSKSVKRLVLGIGLFVSFIIPRIMSDFADDIDGSRLGGWALFSYGVGVFAFIILLGWGATRLRRP